MYRAENVEEWTKNFLLYSQLIDGCDIYSNGNVENAFITTGLTATKTLSRQNASLLQQKILAGEELVYPVPATEFDWIITSEASPGELQ